LNGTLFEAKQAQCFGHEEDLTAKGTSLQLLVPRSLLPSTPLRGARCLEVVVFILFFSASPDREVITCLSYFLTFFSFSLLGVIAVVIFILLCITAIAIHIYRKKSRYSKNEKKGSENEDSAESALKSELSIQNTASENQKEYFF